MSRAPRTTEKRESVDEYLASWHATMKFLREGRSFSGRERNRAFLNCGNSAFANVSSVTGLDFADDGRALASVDWDHDGDLDLWLLNRTGPRLRMMQNQTISGTAGSGERFLSLDLRGTHSNRDAIGARVEVVLKEKDGLPLIRTLYAGDGYLSQSSKSLHFGLGADAEVDRVTVRWPRGETEQFTSIASNRRYLLVEGSGRAEQVARPQSQSSVASKIVASTQVAPRSSAAARIVLSNRLPMPILRPSDYDGNALPAIEVNDRPLLINFWASWCAPCVEELEDWTAQADVLRGDGIELLALSVDGMGDDPATSPTDAKEVLNRIGFPFSHAVANAELIDKLTVVQRVVLNQQPSFAVPTSFLVDSEGRLVAIYRGAVSADVVRQDIQRLAAASDDRRDLAIPFRGRWSSKPRRLLLQPVATVFKERGYVEDYERYIELDLKRRIRQRAVATSEEERRRIDEEFATTQFNLARTLQSYGHRREAIEHFREGLAVKSNDQLAHLFLARLLVREKESAAAIEHFQAALADGAVLSASQSAESHFNLGVALANQRKAEDAIKHFQAAVEFRSDHVDAQTNLGAMLAGSGQLDSGLPHLAKAVKLDPEHLPSRMNYAGALGSSGDHRAAIEQYEHAVKLQPDLAAAHARLAHSLLAVADERRAVEHFEKAISLRPSDGASMLRLAWIWATSNDDSLRSGERALAMANQVNVATGKKDPRALDVLAAAYAEQGEFDAAVRAAKRSLELLGSKNAGLKLAIQKRLETYSKGRAHREERGD